MPENVATPSGAPAHPVARAENILATLDAEEAKATVADPAPESKAPAAPETEPEPSPKAEPASSDTETPTIDEAPDTSPRYKVKVNGQEVEATLDELMKGYSRTEDYKAKTAATAREREAAEALKREVETERQRVASERQRYLDGLNNAAQWVERFDPVLAQGSRTDWTQLAKDDPAGYIEKKAEYDQRLEFLRAAHAERQRLSEQQSSEHSRREAAALHEKLPEAADPEKGPAYLGAIFEAARKHYGFTDDRLKGIDDHRYLLVLDDARKYREMKAKEKQLSTQKAAPAASPVKPKAEQAKPRNDALRKQAINERNPMRRAELIARQIEDE